MANKRIVDVDKETNFDSIFVNQEDTLKQIVKEDFYNTLRQDVIDEITVTKSRTILTVTDLVGSCIHSNYPSTTVMNDSGAWMKWKYKADTQNHIEQNYMSKSEFESLVEKIVALESQN